MIRAIIFTDIATDMILIQKKGAPCDSDIAGCAFL